MACGMLSLRGMNANNEIPSVADGRTFVAIAVSPWNASEITVHEYTMGQIDSYTKRFSGRGAMTRATKYALATGKELIDQRIMTGLQCEVYDRFVK